MSKVTGLVSLQTDKSSSFYPWNHVAAVVDHETNLLDQLKDFLIALQYAGLEDVPEHIL